MRRIAAAVLIFGAFLAAPGGASAFDGTANATANVCDSASHQLGVRATMPGGNFGERMYMRFGADWLNPATKTWQGIQGSISQWIAAAPGSWMYYESGFTRTFNPTGSEHFTLRGVAQLEWRGPAGTRTQLLVTSPCVL